MSLRQRINEATRGNHNRYPVWVVVECRRLYREGKTIGEIMNLTGVSFGTLHSWKNPFKGDWNDVGPWDDPIKPLEQPKRSRLVMPADAAGCLSVAAELLWLARGCRP